MKKKILTALLIVVTSLAYGQKYPKYVLPGDTMLVKPVHDTLWIITDSQLKNSIKAGLELKNAEKQLALYEKQSKLLKEEIAQKDSIITLVTENRDYYKKNWEECSENVKILAKLNKRQSSYTKIAVIGGVTVSIITFFLGAYLL